MIPKFRYFNKLTKEIYASDFYVTSDGHVIDVYNLNNPVDMGAVAILMQSTGLFDKNGVEIFEGDVVLENGWLRKVVSFGTQEVEENFGDKSIFQGFNLCLGGGYPTAVMSDFEVLGNIHEAPELLENSDGH